MEALSSHSKDLIQLIRRLGALDIATALPSLPKFAVVGDQSSGKSSLIEALCDISLPRSGGTCTKCPFQITTTSSKNGQDWNCTVSLNRKYRYDPDFKAGHDATQYHRWVECTDPQPACFTTFKDKTKLEEVLRRAQKAILTTEGVAGDFFEFQLPESTTEVGFSPNTVDVHITGPALPELSFIDLPGATMASEKTSDGYLVETVKRLIKNYVLDENTLVLLVASCNQDTHNSIALNYVRDCDKIEGYTALDRCMGVLTKPDLTLDEHIDRLEATMNGKMFQLGRGWYVSKQLSQGQVDKQMSYKAARADEQRFFATQEPWCSRFARFARRCGIPKLQDKISAEYHNHIVNSLPEIYNRVYARLDIVQSDLDGFPGSDNCPSSTVWEEIDKLSRLIIHDLAGEGLGSKFRTQFTLKLEELEAALKRARPDVRNVDTKHATGKRSKDNDDEESASISNKRPRTSNSRKGAKGQGIKTSGTRKSNRNVRVRSSISEKDIADDVRAIFDLTEVRKWCKDGSGSMLPNQPNSKVADSLVLRSLEGWPSLVDRTLERLQESSQELLTTRIKETLARRLDVKLYTESQKVVIDLFGSLMDQAKDFVDIMLKGELHKPVTFAKTTLQHIKNDEMERLSKLGDNKNFIHEVEAVATALAYYDIASTSIIDHIAKLLEYAVLSKFEMDLRFMLRKELDVLNVERCGELLKCKPEREQERLRLEDEQEKLEQALGELDTLTHAVQREDTS